MVASSCVVSRCLKKETNIERIAAKKKEVQAKGMHKGGVVTIRVQPGQGVTVVAA